jgi:protocatechuate 3,4-dioxygenase, alpha subunit
MSLPTTPSQTVGPFYSIGLCRRPENELVPPAHAGSRQLSGVVYDGAGDPIGDAVVELWDAASGRWGRSGTDHAGRFEFTIAKPDRQNGDAPHLDVYVFARGLLKHQRTRVYFPNELEANAEDAVLTMLEPADAATLVAADEDGVLRFDVHMQGDRATVFFGL